MSDVTEESSAPKEDAQLVRVRRAFYAAHKRMCTAEFDGALEDELSNMLHHLYRLGELTKDRLGLTDQQLNDRLGQTVPDALGAFWIRTYDTHDVAVTTKVGDAYADSYTAMYGVAVWKPIEEMPFVKTDRAGRSKHYSESLTDCPVLDTLSAAFDALAELAAEPMTPPPSPGAMT